MRRKHVSYIFIAVAVAALIIILFSHDRIQPLPLIEKMEKRQQKEPVGHGDTIKALIFYHAADYFVYQGSVIGFQYDLIRQLGADLNRPVVIDIETDPKKTFLKSFSDQYDVVGFDFDKSNYQPWYICESEPHSYTYPVLITRKKTKLDTDTLHVVHAPENYLHPVDFSILGDPHNWKLQKDEGVEMEDLFDMLEDKKVDYIVCNYNEAITLLPFYRSLSLGPRVGENFPRTWVLHSAQDTLNNIINQWLREFVTTKQYKRLCERYLSPQSYIIQRSFGSRRDNISSYDQYMKSACARYNLDWRFMSSIIYQESHFVTGLIGMGGSFGIMQMMPATGARYGISDTSSVADQIWAGARYISYLYKIFVNKVDTSDIYYFVAGSYNSGPGHILDAQELCKKYGGDYLHWPDVAEYLMLKSHKDYYTDPVVKCGYYPGKHTVNYVAEVMDRFHGYVITKSE